MALWDLFRLLWQTPAAAPTESAPAVAEPAVFTVLLAPVANDADGSVTTALEQALGGNTTGLTVLRGTHPLSTDADDGDPLIPGTFARACSRARKAGEAANALVVVWADRVAEGGVRVYFLPIDYDGDTASGTLLAGDMIELPWPLGATQELISASALCALQLHADVDRRRRFERLRTAAQAVEHLLQTKPSPLAGKAIPGATLCWSAMLGEMGVRTGQPALISRAAELCRAALVKGKGVLAPVQMAAGRAHLGDLMADIGSREETPAHLTEAAEHYRAAISVLSADMFPTENALIMAQMGRCLHRLADLEAKGDTMRDAVMCYRAAALVWTKGSRPQRWAELQNGIGALLTRMGEVSGRSEAFERAAKVFEAAAEVWTKKDEPRRWAGLQNNIGACRFALGKASQTLPPLRAATECFSQALAVYQGLNMTRNVHVTQKNLARVERLIGVLESRAA